MRALLLLLDLLLLLLMLKHGCLVAPRLREPCGRVRVLEGVLLGQLHVGHLLDVKVVVKVGLVMLISGVVLRLLLLLLLLLLHTVVAPKADEMCLLVDVFLQL